MKKLIITIAAVVGIVGLGAFLASQDSQNNKQAPTDSSAPLSGDEYPSLGSEHIDNGANHAPYNSNPPTSGPHYVQAARWGVYQQVLPDEQLVHNLEHGGIWISYKDIDQTTKDNLERIGRSNPGNVLVVPRENNDAKISVASWTRLMKLDSYDEKKILDFIKSNTNKSPEPISTASSM